MVLVFPGLSSDDNRWPGMLINAQHADWPAAKGSLGTAQWETYFVSELIPYVDAHFGTDPGRRAVDGFSLGGFMAAKVAAQHPALWQSIGAYDGTFFWDDPADAHTIALTDTTFLNSMFHPVWGDLPDRAFAAANNPANLIRNGDAAALGRLQWLIEYGPESAEPNNSNFYRGEHLVALLAAQGIANHGGAIAGGRHTWHQADLHLARTLPLHWQRLAGGAR